MIIKQMLGIVWVRNEDGGAFYEDENGNDWYEFRNKLSHDKPIIRVTSDTRVVTMYWKGDPSYVGLIKEKVDVYQLDQFPVKDIDDFLSRSFTFSKDGKITETTPAPVARTKEDIMADLLKLQSELSKM